MDVNKITLTVPINWQHDIIPFLSDSNIGNVYGKINGDFIGSATLLQNSDIKISKDGVIKYIKDAHSQGVRFTYIIDTTCLDNLEWTRAGQKQIRRLLDRLVFFGVDSVSVSIPYLAELIKKQYPRLGIEISSAVEIDSVQRARRWEDLGADLITLASYKINRNFNLLREIRGNVKCDLQLVANHSCLNNCVNHALHANVISHITQQSHSNDNNMDTYYNLWYIEQRAKEKFEIISSQWIRPEDAGYYEEIGINKLQLLGINMDSNGIIRLINAYSKRSHKGNLAELFPGCSKGISRDDCKKTIMPNIFINNSDLDKFIDYFIEERCYRLCDECGYCKDIANKAVQAGNIEDTLRSCADYLNDYI